MHVSRPYIVKEERAKTCLSSRLRYVLFTSELRRSTAVLADRLGTT